MNYPGFSDSQNISARRDQSIEGVVLAGGAGTHLYLLKKVGDPERSREWQPSMNPTGGSRRSRRNQRSPRAITQ